LNHILFNGTLTSAMYNDFLQNTLPQLLKDVNLATRQRLWMQQDGASPHYARVICEIFLIGCSNCWIGRDFVSWPPRSPDLTPLDFFWGLFEKYRVSRTAYNSWRYENANKNTHGNCLNNITNVAAAKKKSFCRRIFLNFVCYCNVCYIV